MARAMKDSGIPWVGEIPEEWEISRVGLHFDIILGKMLCSAQPSEDYTLERYYCAANVHFDGVSNDELKQMWFSEVEKEQCEVQKGDLLVVEGGAGAGGCAIVGDLQEKTYIQNSIMIVRAKKGKDNRYLRYLIECLVKMGYIDVVCNKATIPHFTKDKLANVPFFLSTEQSKIANFLDDECARIDAVIEQTRASIEEYKKLKQAVITQAVTKGIHPNRHMKDSGIEWIGEIQSNYRIYRMKHLIAEPLMYGANESGIPYEDNLPRYIRITDITMDGKLKDSGKLSLPEDLAKEYLLDDGDVLFARSGATVGKAFIYKKEYGKSAFAGYLIRARFNALIIPELLFYYTQSSIYEEWKKQIFIQSTIQNIGADRYNQLPVVVSPIEEQHEILSYIHSKASEIDRLLQDKESLIDDLESYKKSMIFEYVTGKKEVFIHEEE